MMVLAAQQTFWKSPLMMALTDLQSSWMFLLTMVVMALQTV
jgi:hypothetical protein